MNFIARCFKQHLKSFEKGEHSNYRHENIENITETIIGLDQEFVDGFSNSDGQITIDSIKTAINASGIIYSKDPRLSSLSVRLEQCDPYRPLTKEKFFQISKDNFAFLHKIASDELAVTNFPDFRKHIIRIYNEIEPEREGATADYIPILRDADPEKFAVAFCSVDGQYFEYGDFQEEYSIQSASKPITFAQTIEEQGVKTLLDWCSVEPSGRPFDDGTLLPDNRPFNPMVNSGALMTAAVLAAGHPELTLRDEPVGADRLYGRELFESILLPLWKRLSGNGIVGTIKFSEETFLSERRTADNNISISYGMKARKGLPPNVKIGTMIDLYLRACSITANTGCIAVTAATLANGGRNPITGDRVFSVDTVKNTLSVLSFCGFYDNAGEFFFSTGMPSKSGVSGVTFLVLPNIGGFAFFSPRLNEYGNSVRGSLFARKLAEMFTYHTFGNLTSHWSGHTLDPNLCCECSRKRGILRGQWAVRRQNRSKFCS